MMKNDHRKNTGGSSNRRVYITAVAGIAAIAALIVIGVVSNEEPDMTLPISPTQGAYEYPELDESWLTNQGTTAPTRVPTKSPTKAPSATQAVTLSPMAPTNAPTAVPDREVTPMPDETTGSGETQENVVDKEDSEVVSAEALASLHLDTERGLNWPVLGEVVLRFSTDHGVYHETLNSFRTNDGLMLAAEEGTPVVSAADGIVTDIFEDTMRGTCVAMALGDGYEAVYGQLDEVSCEVGDKLDEGDRIGTVGKTTKYYTLEGNHLYFKLVKDDAPINPMLLLRELSTSNEE